MSPVFPNWNDALITPVPVVSRYQFPLVFRNTPTALAGHTRQSNNNEKTNNKITDVFFTSFTPHPAKTNR
jgi:hypothetical protein